ncbi:hypothetical protein EF847_20095 [Actinobacteria bacterium YIM 96077]|uniref:Uncharacterized protein n=1 Tax=Phytoactinopolyspora halophila TaxID=1981511 RepID=A0A329QM35_9ACTN|nr:SpaA isopeptide-forming pilin-related protein [Phytoactinopolyspora halophila]AYY14650.1 hypothetical protein EF847_20095 [Actinobacteria bacterium YIM 96077]RAW11638.1 hypothetical protein DPM12_16355 [Phytoactinopolyspora halophila]
MKARKSPASTWVRARAAGKAGLTAAAATALAGAGLVALPSLPAWAEDGPNGEVEGYHWPGADPERGNNWEGTYRYPDGETMGWCASWLAWQPIYADDYVDGGELTYRNGDPMEPEKLRELAYIISAGSDVVLNEEGKIVDDYSAAVAVIMHNDTTEDDQYPEDVVINFFENNTDPEGNGQVTEDVPEIIEKLRTDAQTLYGPWETTVTADGTDDLVVGDEVEFTVEIIAGSGEPVPDRDVEIDTTGLADAPAQVTTDASGIATFTATVTDETAEVTASRLAPAETVDMQVPTSQHEGSWPQNMVKVDDNRTSGSTTVEAQQATGTAEVVKVDPEADDPEEPIAGATVEIRDAEDEVVETVTTEDEPVAVNDLPLGDYTAVEVDAPDGYIQDQTPVPFSLTEAGQTERVVVENLKGPDVTTQATAEQYVGLPIHDTADVTGHVPDDSVLTFELYGPSDEPACEDPIFSSEEITLSESGEYQMSDHYTPTEPGTYYWIEELTSADGQVLSRGECGADGEVTDVYDVPDVSTQAVPDQLVGEPITDTAIVSGDVIEGTAVEFELYGPSDEPTCEDPIFTSEQVDVPEAGEYPMTDSYTPSEAGTYYWVEHLIAPDGTVIASGDCGDENEITTVHPGDTDELPDTGAGGLGMAAAAGMLMLAAGAYTVRRTALSRSTS